MIATVSDAGNDRCAAVQNRAGIRQPNGLYGCALQTHGRGMRNESTIPACAAARAQRIHMRRLVMHRYRRIWNRFLYDGSKAEREMNFGHAREIDSEDLCAFYHNAV